MTAIQKFSRQRACRAFTSDGLNRPNGFIVPFRITVFRPNLYTSQMIKNGSNILAHYNLESRTIIWKKSNLSSNLKTHTFYILRFSINFMAATIAMIKSVCQMGIVYMFEESEIFLHNICGNEVHRWVFTD